MTNAFIIIIFPRIVMVDIFNEYRIQKIKDYLRYIPDFYKEILQTWISMGGGQTKILIKKNVSMV
jgi:hypothetical protein